MVATSVLSRTSVVPQVVRESRDGLSVHRLPAEYKVTDVWTSSLKTV